MRFVEFVSADFRSWAGVGIRLLLILACTAGCSRLEPVRPGAPRGHPIEADRLHGSQSIHDLRIENGWFTHRGHVVWGNALHNGWWGAYRPNLTRRAPKQIGPCRTENLELLTDAMVAFGYPGFEHNFGLWFDRRRDAHDVLRRSNSAAVGPYLEQPWARSTRGQAWDGLPLYDLEEFNPWYFERLVEFARLCDQKGSILIFNFYMQHALLELQSHYVDFPWRPVNAIQNTGMPDQIPAANAFYDTGHPLRNQLHRAYIRKCLDELGAFRNVVFLPGMEFTGPRTFVEFWLDTVREWEIEHNRRLLIGVGATKDVLDAVLSDPQRAPGIAVIDLRYWCFRLSGRLYAPRGGREHPGRFAGGFQSRKASPELIYRQVLDYRRAFPDRAILHTIYADRQQTWAFLMAGGSLLVRTLNYPAPPKPAPWQPPEEYIAPGESRFVLPAYNFIRTHLSTVWPRMRPAPERVSAGALPIWALSDGDRNLVVYSLRGGRFRISLGDPGSRWNLRRLDPQSGELGEAERIGSRGWTDVQTPSHRDWVLWFAEDD